jgi:hypothetical protein
MPERNGLLITGHKDEATCCACNKLKEALYLESVDGSFSGWVCMTHLKAVLRLSLANRPRSDRATPLFEGNGSSMSEREAIPR